MVLLNYNTNGYLTNIVAGFQAPNKQGVMTNAFLSTNSFTWDNPGRVRTVTDPLGYTITYNYDAWDRPTNVTYMDGTYEQTVYKYLDAELARDRNGHWTAMEHDPLRHLTDTYDNLGRHTHFDWCTCGALTGLTDPLGHTTTWLRDLQNRVTAKVYADNTQTTYAYETNSSRLKMVTDAKNQSTLYGYLVDNNLSQVTYSNAVVATSNVSFTYDTNYNRLVTMTDGTGVTTYRYYNVAAGQLGAGLLSSVSNSFIGSSSVISYNYDALSRATNRAINGVSEIVAFDALHRVTLVTNALGRFTNTYVGGTMLISTNLYPNGQKTVFSYFSVTNDERLSEIWNKNSTNGTLSKFDYGYDLVGEITNWTQQVDTNAATVYSYGYDMGNQLLSAVLKSTGVGATALKQFGYGYDLAGNRTSEQIDTGMSQAIYNNVNELTSRATGSGPMQFAGSVSRQATVTVGGNAATVNHATTNFVGYAGVVSGTNVVPITATDYGNHSRTNNYQVVVTNGAPALSPQYDANGNMTNDGAGLTYEWDAADRVTAINRGGTNRTEFLYDGLGRRVQALERTNGVAMSTNKYVWRGLGLCEQRDATGGTVVKRFYGGGEQISGTNYFPTRDHLGSVREMTDGTGSIKARYDYDPYGRRAKLSGTMDADFGYTGHLMLASQPDHTLALYRLYRPDLGRWLNRDPVKEHGDLNLYRFVGNRPILKIDPFGLCDEYALMGMGGQGMASFASPQGVAGLGEALGAAQQTGYPADQVVSAAANEDFAQSTHIPADEFVFAGGEFPLGVSGLNGEGLGLLGINDGGFYYGGLGAIGHGLMFGYEQTSQGGEPIWLLDPGAGWGLYHSAHGTGAFAYWPPGSPGFVGCGLGITH